MQKLYNGYHFWDRCIDKRTGNISIVHIYNDYTDINNSVNDDKNDDLNKTLIELKDSVKEDLKDYIRTKI